MVGSGWTRNGFVYLLILVAAAALFFSLFPQQKQPDMATASQVAQWIQENKVASVDVDGETVTVETKDGQTYSTTKDANASFNELMMGLGVTPEQLGDPDLQITVKPPAELGSWLGIMASILPLLFIGGLFFFLMRQAQGSNSQAMSFGKSKARMFTGDKPTVTFDDVAGAEESKEELQEIVEFLKEPQKFAALGARIPKGVLLVGPPGTGKTLMAKAVSGEAGVPFFSISGSEFVEMFVGVGASRVRDLFEQAKRNSPCIVFIDEIDAVGRHRGAGLGGSHDEREQTLNQILVEMDGFDTDTNVIIVAATNRPDILDPALLRPGRFDRRVIMDQPDVKGRRAILDIHVRGKPLAEEVDLDAVARGTPGFVGADIENMVNESAILAARRNRRTISQAELTEAVERVALGGPERHSRVISAEEKRIVAYHEAGHASLRKLLPNTDPVYKISIIPRGQAAGYVLSFPEEDRGLVTQPWFEDFIAVALGGRVAEELIFDEITDGARDDLDRVTQIARRMVTRFGMSKTLGPMVYGRKQEMVFLGREMSEQRDYSEAIAIEIDREVKAIVDHAYQKARTSLQENIDKLKLVAETLIEIETLTADEFNALWDSDNAAEVLPPPTPQPLPTRPPERRREESRSGGPQTNTPPNPAPSPA
ncbi:MAG: ATP-dependent zinc metalloprotease FtsH [Anaerolineales bacterium]|nr:ATP-dependent zinc metalloprotease FtsH [Anaerolineales bacterium]MCO5243311.1 ATP-dependent zinc metalloprotease FtsH [Anaerolineae bacterium]